jgi:hypothetical protein
MTVEHINDTQPKNMDTLPPYSEILGFQDQDMIIRGAKGAQYSRVMNDESTFDLLHISDPENERKRFHFHQRTIDGPIVFTIAELNIAPNFRITDHLRNEKIIISRTVYNTGEKYQFKLPDGTKYSWKQIGTGYKLIQYPDKNTVATMTAKEKTIKGISTSPIGNTMLFTMLEKNSDLYHFAWLTGFAANWQMCKRGGTTPLR